jgi:quinol monooxygenase YgiN
MVRITRNSFGVIARLRSLPEKADELRRRLHDLTGLTRREQGCISCELAENVCDATEFTLLEEWSNENAHKEHFATNLIQSALWFLPGLLTRELDLRKYILPLNAIRYGTNSYCLAVI